ncbi:UDP-3-O-(3-hydroxymyristoyl)glucosamine N-acyltransferase [Teredinibacter waterburyi]|jgi:UDP-3-O-[3-hydroxymyristoyl] glucosamine N-acyltransferase (EC 2.3.1.-)|uniref:UDP-3-O-(3-hydroxymyristoyl)glucosamine N-acyltransferase n=1 Tax=Teredinibacter waterburyi TaxID=1500538 RepID=UPI00165FEBEE|nr:UDP-3-O-(3-hydroxymyristoyl)glucosamine N-acyltransferase [Teredinibacter waterburyi]
MQGSTFNLQQLAEHLACEFVGDASYEVNAVAPVEVATRSDLTFVAQERLLKLLAECNAGIVLLNPAHESDFSGNKLLVTDPYLAYAKLSKLFDMRVARNQGVHPSAVVSSSAKIAPTAAVSANCVVGDNVEIGENTELYPGCVIGDGVVIGARCLLHANVTLYADVILGNDVIIHSATVIGSDGFGFSPSKDGWIKIHQLGRVRIGNRVEIGANTAIDRGALTDTEIGDGVIIDNQVHLAHGVKVGRNTAIAGCVGVAGSTVIGENCTIAGMVAINGHISIADNTHFNGGTVVTKGNTEAGVFASTTPLQDVRSWRKNSVRYTQLDEMASRIRKLEKALEKL